MQAGWTILRPSGDSRRVYVSSVTGDDANDGSNYKTAVRTLGRAKTLVRHGYPDWVLLRRGDVWDEPVGHWKASGRSATARMVLTAYGAAVERPLIRTGTGEGLFTQGGGGSPASIDHLAVVGLHFAGSGDNGLRFLVPGRDVLVEDCKVEGFRVNVLFQGFDGELRDYRLRRSVIVDSDGSTKAHSQGMYAYDVHGLLIEQNVFDRNGHPADIFSHNIYLDNGNSGVILRGNIISRASSHGAQMRSGGVAWNNLFLRCPIALQIGGGNAPESGGVDFEARGNVVMDGANIDAENPRGWGVLFQNIREGHFVSNLIANSGQARQPAALILDGQSQYGVHGVHNISFERNVIHAWRGGVEMHGDVSDLAQDGDNFDIGHNEMIARRFTDPERDVANYYSAIGLVGTFEDFIASARMQSSKRWLPRLMAGAVNTYLRDGFNIGFP
jgi:hypothetical protein